MSQISIYPAAREVSPATTIEEKKKGG